MIDIQTAKNFIWFCIFFVTGYSELTTAADFSEEALICLLEECLVISAYLCDNRAIISLYALLGEICNSSGQCHKAIEYHENSLAIEEEFGNRRGVGNAYEHLGNAYDSLGEYYTAIEYHGKSLEIAKEIGNRPGEGSSYGNLGNAYQSLRKYRKAIECYEKSLSIAKETGDRRAEGMACGELGDAYNSLEEYRKATEYLEKHLSIAQEIGEIDGVALGYSRLGNVYQSLGEYRKAIECHEKSLQVIQETGEKEDEVSTRLNVGNIYFLIGEYHQAIDFFKESLNIAKDICDKKGEGNACQGLGGAYGALNEYHTAIKYNEKRLSIAKEIYDRQGEGNAYFNLGSSYRSLGKYQKAVEYLENSLRISKETGSRDNEGNVCVNLGNIWVFLGEYQKAFKYYEMSLNVTKGSEDIDSEASRHRDIGAFYAFGSTNFQNLSKAEEHLKRSIDCYEKMFEDLKVQEQLTIPFVDTCVESYKALSEILLRSKKTEEALLVCERGRARALKDLLTLKYNTTKTINQKSLDIDDCKNISSKCDAGVVFYELHQNKLSARFWAVTFAFKSVFFYDELEERETLIKTISDLSEDERESTGKGYFQNLVEDSLTIMELREGMKCEDRSSILPENQFFTFSKITSNPPRETSTSKVIKEHSRCAYLDDDDDNPLEMLYDRLVSPMLNVVTEDDIVIIPDGSLFMVPFPALQDPKTHKFLSETKCLRLAPSLTTLKVLQESSDDYHYKSGALIVGDPAVGEVMYRGRKLQSIHRLPGARDEAIKIGQILGVQPVIGEQATKEAILTKLRQGVSIIHFAAHGSAKNGQIFLAPSRSPRKDDTVPVEEDYILTMKEVQESGIRAQLVVLSCCHSGRGEIRSEGVVGMARAFLAAGARAVVASLWAVEDEATRLFMLKFYSHLKNGASASRGLQKTMKEMRETEKYKDPMYWAAFFVIGDDVTITV